jgi:two-component system, OmpR family, response regulator CpxR
MSETPSISLLMIDDDAELCQLVKEFLESQNFKVETLHDGKTGLARALTTDASLILLDVMMPGMNGFDLLRSLREVKQTPVIMLTARTDQRDRITGLDAGADDYLPKPFDPQELGARIRAVLRRTQPATGRPVFEAGGVKIDSTTRQVTQAGRKVDLTSIEFDILEVLMRNSGHVVTRNDLMNSLYQREATAFDRSIDVHVSHLRKKFEDPDMILTIRGSGYQFSAKEPG